MFRVERVTTIRCTSEYTRDEVVTMLASMSPNQTMNGGLREYYQALDDDTLAVELQDSLFFEPPMMNVALQQARRTTDVKFAVTTT